MWIDQFELFDPTNGNNSNLTISKETGGTELWFRSSAPIHSGQDVSDDAAFDVRQTEIAALESIGELFVVEAEQM